MLKLSESARKWCFEQADILKQMEQKNAPEIPEKKKRAAIGRSLITKDKWLL